ncbi:DUF255 domain-containing protein [Priestia flexa]
MIKSLGYTICHWCHVMEKKSSKSCSLNTFC